MKSKQNFEKSDSAANSPRYCKKQGSPKRYISLSLAPNTRQSCHFLQSSALLSPTASMPAPLSTGVYRISLNAPDAFLNTATARPKVGDAVVVGTGSGNDLVMNAILKSLLCYWPLIIREVAYWTMDRSDKWSSRNQTLPEQLHLPLQHSRGKHNLYYTSTELRRL